MSNSIVKVALALLASGLGACDRLPLDGAAAADTAPPSEQDLAAAPEGSLLAQVRAATARYHDVGEAVANGYVRATACIYNTPGGRGHIFAKFPLIDGVVDPSLPELLIYEPRKNGEMRLVAVGFIVQSAAWDPFHSSPPALGDQAFLDRRSPPFGAAFPNYVLFAWVWRHNPIGMYALYNPHVSCEYADVAEMR